MHANHKLGYCLGTARQLHFTGIRAWEEPGVSAWRYIEMLFKSLTFHDETLKRGNQMGNGLISWNNCYCYLIQTVYFIPSVNVSLGCGQGVMLYNYVNFPDIDTVLQVFMLICTYMYIYVEAHGYIFTHNTYTQTHPQTVSLTHRYRIYIIYI